MGLSLQQKIASVERQLQRLKEEVEEQKLENKEKLQTFSITFTYTTTTSSWGAREKIDSNSVFDFIKDNLHVFRDELLTEPNESLELSSVVEKDSQL